MSGSDVSKLDGIAEDHRQNEGFTPRLITCRANTLEILLEPGSVLDLGCADGLLTAHLAARHKRVFAVDASRVRIARARAATSGLGSVELIQSTFEELEFSPDERFTGIVLSCVLEHVTDPVELLKLVSKWLVPSGTIVAIVPHSGSLHRRVGVKMGFIADVTDSGEQDEACGHQQVYTLEGLKADFRAAGLQVVDSGGYLMKPFTNDEMAQLPPEMVNAFEELGREYPEFAAEIYVAGQTG